MAIFPSFLIYVLWKTAFRVVYVRLPSLVCSILYVVDRVRNAKVLYSNSASVLWDLYILTLTDLSVYNTYCVYCIGGSVIVMVILAESSTVVTKLNYGNVCVLNDLSLQAGCLFASVCAQNTCLRCVRKN
jgi:predicted Abi (CAAX) family protease